MGEETERLYREDWTSAGIGELVTHLLGTHHRLARALCDDLLHAHPLPVLIDFIRFLVAHQEYEERELFPRCLALEDQLTRSVPQAVEGLDAAIHAMSVSHAELDALVAEVGGILPGDATLATLVSDLRLHHHKEDTILLPAVLYARDLLATRIRRSVSGSLLAIPPVRPDR